MLDPRRGRSELKRVIGGPAFAATSDPHRAPADASLYSPAPAASPNHASGRPADELLKPSQRVEDGVGLVCVTDAPAEVEMRRPTWVADQGWGYVRAAASGTW